MSRNRLAGLSLAMLMALFLAMSVGTSVMGKQPGQRATGDIPARDPTPPRYVMFVGPKTPSYQQLTPAAKGLYAVMREGFGIRSVGGWRPVGSVEGSDHPHGRAIDAMVDYPNPEARALGWRIAKWAVAHADTFDVKYVIFNGRIWTRSRGWHGYQHPSDRCNCDPTLRHDDHVHISVRHWGVGISRSATPSSRGGSSWASASVAMIVPGERQRSWRAPGGAGRQLGVRSWPEACRCMPGPQRLSALFPSAAVWRE